MDNEGTTACVVDHGLFLPLAHRLAEEYKRVLYYSPHEDGFPHFSKRVIGDGFGDIERCNDVWKVKDKVDLFVFPDIGWDGMQLELEAQGKPVWGSRSADSIEIHREKFMALLKRLDLDVPPYKKIVGLTALRDHLLDASECYVKVSVFRGDHETRRHESYDKSRPWLDQLAIKFGPFQDEIPFIVCEPIKTDIEVGYDGFCVDGKFPAIAVQGYEAKNKAYLCAVRQYDELPEQVREINDAFGPELAKYQYRNFFSTEIRVKGKKCYFIDPCMRLASPAGEAMQRLFGNLGDIIASGAQGVLVEPEPIAEFAAQCVLTMDATKREWRTFNVPEELRKWTMFGGSCGSGSIVCEPPDDSDDREIGWVLGVGDSIEESIEAMKEHASMLGDGITAHTEAIADLLVEIKQAEERGIDFTDQPIPEPEIAIAPAD